MLLVSDSSLLTYENLMCQLNYSMHGSREGEGGPVCWSVKQKSGTASVNRDSQWRKQESLFDVRSVLHGQVSLAAVNHICIIDEAMNGCKNLKVH